MADSRGNSSETSASGKKNKKKTWTYEEIELRFKPDQAISLRNGGDSRTNLNFLKILKMHFGRKTTQKLS